MKKLIILFYCVFFFVVIAKAQFTITETFMGSSLSSDIISGGVATLTSGNADPIDEGWLRLTQAAGNQRGYAYVNSSFPSTLGVVMEFEYKTWRNKSDSYNGADGFSVFLFDATIPSFATGGYGGSLGYAPNSSGGTATGLTGGYLGIGFDEYGNFAVASEGRVGGFTSRRPNSVTLRGATTSNSATTNPYLASVQMQTSSSNNTNSIDYNTVTSTRPSDATFYRKVKITIIPTGTGSYVITVYWQTSTSGSYVQLLTYTTTIAPPPSLKVGFAASTGGGFNYHEIRNLYITTPGNLRVTKDVNKSNVNVGDQLTYTVNIVNETPVALTNIAFADTLKAGNGAPMVLGADFEINSITFNNNGNSGTTALGYTSGTAKTSGFANPWNTTLNVAANNIATFTIVGKVLNQPSGINLVKNSVGIDPTSTGITDQDLTNNYYTVGTTVLTPNVDFKIEKSVDRTCSDPVNGNTFTISVMNVGATSSGANKMITVTDVIPSGFTIKSVSGTGWTITSSGNTYTFKRSDALASAYAYPNISIQVLPPSTGTFWTNTATVAYADTEFNTTNNSSSATINATPAVPLLSAVTQPTCSIATGSFIISNYNASCSYTVSPTTGVTISGNTITAPAGIYTVTATFGSCTSLPSANVIVNTQPIIECITFCAWRTTADANDWAADIWEGLDCATGKWVHSTTPPTNDRPTYIFNTVEIPVGRSIVSDSLRIETTGRLEICGQLTIDNEVIFKVDGDGKSGQIINNCGTNMCTVTVGPNATAIVRKKFSTAVGAYTWNFVSVPFDVTEDRIFIAATDTPASWGDLTSATGNFYIGEYDGQKRANDGFTNGSNYVNLPAHTLVANKGYILAAGDGNDSIDFRSIPGTQFACMDTQLETTYYAGARGECDHGWNLIGTPFVSGYNLKNAIGNKPYYVFDVANQTYTTVMAGVDYLIYPFSGFFLQNLGDADGVTFTSSEQTFKTVKGVNSTDEITLVIANATVQDVTRIRLLQDASLNFVRSEDGMKLMSPVLTTPQIYTDASGACGGVAYNSLPLNTTRVDLKVRTGKEDTYTISMIDIYKVTGLNKVILVDTETGIQTNLLEQSYSYEMNSSTATTSSRFYILLSSEVVTDFNLNGNDDIEIRPNGSKLTLTGLNGKATVNMYDAVGKLIFHYDNVTNNYSFDVDMLGMYIMDIKTETQKVRVKVIVK